MEGKLTAAAEQVTDAPAATLAGREDAAQLWAKLDLEARRAVIRSLVTVTIARQGRGHRRPGWKRGESYNWFDPQRIMISWRGEQVSAGEPVHDGEAAAA